MAVIMGSIAVILLVLCLCSLFGGGGGLMQFNKSNPSDFDLSPNNLISLCSSFISSFVFMIIILAVLFFAAKKYM